jgi:hypothetical protein
MVYNWYFLFFYQLNTLQIYGIFFIFQFFFIFFKKVSASGCKRLREPPGGPRSGGKAMSVNERFCEAKTKVLNVPL